MLLLLNIIIVIKIYMYHNQCQEMKTLILLFITPKGSFEYIKIISQLV